MIALSQVLLDTDTLSEIMKEHPMVIQKSQEYLSQHKRFTLSTITRYEILRGLKAKKASKQVASFNRFCRLNIVLPITDEVAVKGADIYADLRRRGRLISDADILIAATALVHGLGIVTNNIEHFKRIQELHVESWQV